MSTQTSVPSELHVQYDIDSPPAHVLQKTAQAVNAVVETNAASVKILGIDGRFLDRLQGMRKGSIIVELEFFIDMAYSVQLNLTGLSDFIFQYMTIIQSFISNADMLTREDLIKIRQQIAILAQRSQANIIDVYRVPNEIELATQILHYQEAVEGFREDEGCKYVAKQGEIKFSKRKVTSKEHNSLVLTRETDTRQGRQAVVIRKPDLLGSAMWEVRYRGKNVRMVIMDLEWLMEFKDKRLQLSSGSGMDIELLEKDEIGYDDEIIDTKYYIKKVYGLVD